MSYEIEEIVYNQNTKAVDSRPLTITWKGEKIIRSHSLRASVKEILQVAKNLDVVKVGIIGDQSTGKTTLSDTLGHLIHKMSDIPFAVRAFGKDEFLNMKKTLESLEPANYVLKFRDLSFLSAQATKKELDIVKQVITVIRHLREDVKIILIYDYHYTLGLDKYLRQANFRYFTSIGSSEDDNILKIVGTKYANRIQHFKRLFVQMSTKSKASFELKKNSFFDYNYKNPFVVCLFWNESRLRYVVFPHRTWIDKICPTCSINDNLGAEVSIEQFLEEAKNKFGSMDTIRVAVKLYAFVNGLNVYSRNISHALKYIDKALQMKQIPLEKLLVHFGLEMNHTRLRKKLDGVLSEDLPDTPKIDTIVK